MLDRTGPDAATAVVDLQRFLEMRTGLWKIHQVTPISASQESREGRPVCQMLADVDLTVETGGRPRREDLQNDPWLTKISGAKGERKSAWLTLTWVRNGSSWKLRSVD